MPVWCQKFCKSRVAALVPQYHVVRFLLGSFVEIYWIVIPLGAVVLPALCGVELCGVALDDGANAVDRQGAILQFIPSSGQCLIKT